MRQPLPAILSRARHALNELWVRSVLIGGLALLAAGASATMPWIVPHGLRDLVSAEDVDALLDIIATSMLAVTIFSLTIMVTIHQATSQQWTPRAHRLIVSDRPMMTVLATFVGTWIFALAAIVLRHTGAIGDGDVVVLFGVTLVVFGLIVVSLMGWIARLETFGSLEQVGARIEREATDGMRRRMEAPCLGGRPLLGGRDAISPGAVAVRAARTGWVRSVEVETIGALAAERGVEVYLWVPIGRFVYEGDAVAYLDPADPVLAEAVRGAVEVGDLRSLEQDPRFGLVVLGEVASRALSPGINDPGTAIEVIGRAARILHLWRDEAKAVREPRFPTLHVAPLDPRDLIEDVFSPIARDGRGKAPVQIHLQHALGSLARSPHPAMAEAAREAAADAWRIAREALDEADLARVARSGGRPPEADEEPLRGLPSAFRDEAARREA